MHWEQILCTVCDLWSIRIIDISLQIDSGGLTCKIIKYKDKQKAFEMESKSKHLTVFCKCKHYNQNA